MALLSALAAAPQALRAAAGAKHGQLLALRRLSSQHNESSSVGSVSSQSQAVDSPPITGDTANRGQDNVSDGRSSQTTSATLAGDELKPLVGRVLGVYELRSLEEQRRLVDKLYSPDAIYENNVALLNGREAIAKRFALLPLSTKSVRVEFDNPVVLGATTSAPDPLNDLAHKGDLQVEVTNRQHYHFDTSHSLWRRILLPQGDAELSVLTRLTLSSSTPRQVLYHRDMWMHNSQWWGPLQRCWGVVEQAAGAAGAHSSSGGSGSGSSKN